VLEEFFELLSVDGKTAQRDLEGIEHHLSRASVARIEELVQFLKKNPVVLRKISSGTPQKEIMKRQVVFVMVALSVLVIVSRAADIMMVLLRSSNDKVITYTRWRCWSSPSSGSLRRSFSGTELEEQTRKAQMDGAQ